MNHKEYGVGIIGTGSYLPDFIETNDELCKTLPPEITPEWIIQKTGIKSRRIAGKGITTSFMALNAAKKAIENAGISIEEIGLIVCCTHSHEYIFPALSAKIMKDLGAKNCQVFDVQANCTGFVTGLTVASDRMFCEPEIKYALVIGAEMQSPFRNTADYNTAIFLSDGAGAAILSKVEPGRGVIASSFHADPSTYESVRLRGGGSSFTFKDRQFDTSIDNMEMNGLATWKQAITNLPISIKRTCAKVKTEVADVDFFLFHQANFQMISYVMAKSKIPMEKTHTNIVDVGNTASASVAIVLDEALKLNKIKKGDTVVLAAVGAGFIFGSSIWKW
ncbi:MAG: ketoacyl-ACP synthase III [Bacteroidetes bacterium]|nr:ketoacyl-ACP synthase III [Bacteroidota bacterium]